MNLYRRSLVVAALVGIIVGGFAPAMIAPCWIVTTFLASCFFREKQFAWLGRRKLTGDEVFMVSIYLWWWAFIALVVQYTHSF